MSASPPPACRFGNLVPHGEFVRALAAAPLVVTDGGSIQEECARIGVPTLLWRARTERPNGLDANVVLGQYDATTVDAFLADPERWRRPPAADVTTSPATAIVGGIVRELMERSESIPRSAWAWRRAGRGQLKAWAPTASMKLA